MTLSLEFLLSAQPNAVRSNFNGSLSPLRRPLNDDDANAQGPPKRLPSAPRS
jgi:hypothetical protein